MNPTVLIVDDSLTVRMDLKESFASAGVDAVTCSTAADARAEIARGSFGLVVLDLILPDGDGIELLREIKASANNASLPVMLLSTEAEVAHRIRGLNTGADEYVGKPYDAAYVVSRARELMRPSGRWRSDVASTTVLVIDDSATYRAELTSALEAAAYTVATAATGEEGLRAAADIRPGAVVVDGMLPGIDGTTVIRRLKQDAALRGTPCLLLTASEERASELRALDAGADAYVRKQESTEVILARLAGILRSRGTDALVQSSSSMLGPKKILAVDDSLTYLHELAANLRSEGFDVVLAHSGEEALELLAFQPVECILLDVLMPGLSGQEVCRRIKASPTWRDVPVVMLTAREERDAMIEGINAGADDYITKSSDFEVVNARLRAQLRRRQFEDENRHIREQLLRKESEAAEARAARELAETRAALFSELELKNAELARAARLKDEFLASMSHELRTPLNSVLGLSEALQELVYGSLNERQLKALRGIEESGRHLLALINDILDLSKIEAGRLELDVEAVSVHDVCKASLHFVQQEALKKRLQVKLSIDGAIATIRGDERRIKQVLVNLLGNAVKFTPEGGSIGLEVVGDAERGEVRFTVWDTGIGISDEDRARLFQPFVQLDSNLSRQYTGTGLGLSLVRRMAELHGGGVSLESRPGCGSRFTVSLPWSDSSERPAPVPAPSTSIAVATRRRRLREALVVEDSLAAAEQICRYLSDSGVRARVCPRLDGVVAKAIENQPDIIILDLLVQGCTGWDVLKKLKAEPRTRSIPVLIASVLDERPQGLRLGAAGYLTKPISREQFVTALNEISDRGRAEPASASNVGPESDPCASGPLVLLAEDNESSVVTLVDYFVAKGLRVAVARNGHEAIEEAKARRPDLILMDVQMPGMDGLEATRRLRSDPDLAAIPIVALTALTMAGDRERCLAAGADEYMSKPLNLKALMALIASYVGPWTGSGSPPAAV